MVDDGGRRPHPTWVRILLVGLQALGLVVGLIVGVLTYDAWSQPDSDPAPTTTTVVAPETAVPPDTLG